MFDPFSSFRITGRTALVTGARREIGRAIALGLAGAGARLAIHHAGTAEENSDAAAIQMMGGTAASFGQDFVHDDARQRLAATVTAWAQVDILVLNASIELPEDFQAISREHFDRQIAVNPRTTMAGPGATHGRTRLGSRRDHRQRSAGTAPSCNVRLCGH